MADARIPFSQRHRTRQPPAGGLIYEAITETIATGVGNAALPLTIEHGEFSLDGVYLSSVIARVCLETERPVPRASNSEVLVNVLTRLAWDEFCDACEGLYELFETRGPRFEQHVNRVFARNFFGYEMRNGQIERVGAVTHEEVMEEAQGILADDDLAGPNEQFQDARRLYNARPKPDLDNAVKEAISAVEGLARILLNDRKVLLSKALQRIQQEKGAHPAMMEMIGKLYAYRGDKEGVSHGATEPSQIPLHEAEFAIGTSAQAIVYLARLYGRGVVT